MSRHFFYTTSKKNVYKLVGQYNVDGKGEDEPNIKSSSDIRDHEFDNPGRLRVKPKAKEAKIDQSRNAVAMGTLGVRWDGGFAHMANVCLFLAVCFEMFSEMSPCCGLVVAYLALDLSSALFPGRVGI
ncbi:hypothetical protein DPMN_015299 [Dreissena polymorpha]|uniref:Uncharacterized protein n=1 Tax=Dreissena polymorpha TaxID=45954 RepID=A0A9D4S3H9_DREPO|nr:hypothetical protein DPMN_015299 [Dreissena polymorpha]